jgi:hypothetical protein
MSDPNGQKSEGGLGKDGTIPNSETGIAAGYEPGGSTFEPEEDGPLADGAGARADAGAADADAAAAGAAAVDADAVDTDADADALDADAEADEVSPRDPEAGGGPDLRDL